jgi:DNA gyrase subunit A
VRTPAAEISKIGRGTQGVRLVTLAEGDAVASASRVDKEEGVAEDAVVDGAALPSDPQPGDLPPGDSPRAGPPPTP